MCNNSGAKLLSLPLTAKCAKRFFENSQFAICNSQLSKNIRQA